MKNQRKYRKIQKILGTILTIILLINIFPSSVQGYWYGTLVPKRDGDNTLWQMAGFMHYDIWTGSDGKSWTPIGPNGTNTFPETYPLSLPDGYKIKSVNVRPMAINDEVDRYIWKVTRSEDFEDYETHIAETWEVKKLNTSPLGTSSIDINIEVKVTLGEGKYAKDITASWSENNPGKPIPPNLKGLRYYIPIIIELEVETEEQLSSRVLRAGTEGGIEEEKTYTALMEFELQHYKKLKDPMLNMKIYIEGGEFIDSNSENLIMGQLNMGEENIKKWEEAHTEVVVPSLSIDYKDAGIAWLPKLRLLKEEENRRIGEHILKCAEGRYYQYKPDQSIKRYQYVNWKYDGVSPIVKITATLYYDKDGKYLVGKETIEINMNKELGNFSTGEYTLDYDVRKARFEHKVNGGDPFIAEVHLPQKSLPDFSAWWVENTHGDLSYTIYDPKGLVNDEETEEYGPIDEGSETIVRMPVLRWETDKIDVYGPNLGLEKAKEKKDSFYINTEGEISRLARYSYTEYYWVTHSGTNSDGSTYSYSCKHSRTITGEEMVSDEFKPKPSKDEVEVQSLFFDGSKMPLRSFGGEIGSYEENRNRLAKRTLVWEGDRYDIPVKRFMRHVDENGNTTEIVEEDGYGGKPRIFQHLDTAEVTYTVKESLKEHFAEDRQKARNNPNNYKRETFHYAPFATDNNLQKYDYPIKSGYFYVPYGTYEVKVKTTIYKEGDGGTEKHKDIVEQIKDSFLANIALPTMELNGDAVVGLDGRAYDEIPVGIEEDYSLEEEYKLPYSDGPSTPNEYLNGTEASLLGGTDPLYKRILQGWESSGSREYQDTYKYREYVKEGNIYKIVEETVLLFTLNPSQKRYYIIPQTRNGHYNINIGFKAFNNGHVTVGKTISSIPVTKLDNITFTVVGSMYDDQSSR